MSSRKQYTCRCCGLVGHNVRTCPVAKEQMRAMRHASVASNYQLPVSLSLVVAEPAHIDLTIADESPMEHDLELTPTPRDDSVDIATTGYTGIQLCDDILELVGKQVIIIRDADTLDYHTLGLHRFQQTKLAPYSVARKNRVIAMNWIHNRLGEFYDEPHNEHGYGGGDDRPFHAIEAVVQMGGAVVPYYHIPKISTKARTKSQKGKSHCSKCGGADHKFGSKCPLNPKNQYYKAGSWHHHPLGKECELRQQTCCSQRDRYAFQQHLKTGSRSIYAPKYGMSHLLPQ